MIVNNGGSQLFRQIGLWSKYSLNKQTVCKTISEKFQGSFVKVGKFGTSRVNIKYLKFYLHETISHQDLWGFVMHLWIVEVECDSGNMEHIGILRSWLPHQSAWPLCFHQACLAIDCPWGWTVLICRLVEEAEWKHHSYFGSSTSIRSSSINYYLMSHVLPTVFFKPPGYHFVQQSGKSNGTRVTASLLEFNILPECEKSFGENKGH